MADTTDRSKILVRSAPLHQKIKVKRAFCISRKNPNQVDTRTVRVLMEVAELHRKHLGGQLLFSPDGLLHIILGDGMITLDDMEEMDGLRYDQTSEESQCGSLYLVL